MTAHPVSFGQSSCVRGRRFKALWLGRPCSVQRITPWKWYFITENRYCSISFSGNHDTYSQRVEIISLVFRHFRASENSSRVSILSPGALFCFLHELSPGAKVLGSNQGPTPKYRSLQLACPCEVLARASMSLSRIIAWSSSQVRSQ
jgi:hypothetical protein